MKRAKRKETLTKFDAADYIKTEADAAAYLNTYAEDGDAAEFAEALGTVARSRSMAAIAKKTGLTREGLYKSLSGEGNPSLDTTLKVLTALGLRIDLKPIVKRSKAA